MNIFILDHNIKKCARYHCDRHVVKMILESAQMLSTAVRLMGIDHGYKISHINHPCSIWVRRSLSNWKWLRKLAIELNCEYKFRYDKKANHKSFDLVQSLPVPNIEDYGLTPFAQVMTEKYKHNDPVIAYRNYYIGEKFNLFQWTKRKPPYWVLE